MDILNALLQGFATAITPANLLWALVGCALGTAVGVLPGIGPALTVALLLPVTPGHPELSAVAADPIGVNAALGRYTTFVNLLDLCGLAVPASISADGLPFGVKDIIDTHDMPTFASFLEGRDADEDHLVVADKQASQPQAAKAERRAERHILSLGQRQHAVLQHQRQSQRVVQRLLRFSLRIFQFF